MTKVGRHIDGGIELSVWGRWDKELEGNEGVFQE